ncbi:MAG: hypothetical protein LBB90_07490, partial [Tannerella sp.]|nr:hypothetical protein [Tannerella sp.]
TLSPTEPGSLPAGSETNIALTHSADLASGAYALTLTVSAEGLTPVSISIVYTVAPTGTENVESPALRVIATGDGFLITGLVSGETLNIYSIHGQLFYRSKANGAEQRVPLPARGVYIVVGGNRTVKAVY